MYYIQFKPLVFSRHDQWYATLLLNLSVASIFQSGTRLSSKRMLSLVSLKDKWNRFMKQWN